MMVSADNDPRRAGTIWALDLVEPISPLAARIPAAFQRLESGSLPALSSNLDGEAAAEFGRRLAAGKRSYAACVAGGLAAYGWVSFGEEFVGELNLRLHLLPGEAYIWDCATLPAFRRNRLYSALLSYIVAQLRQEGLHRVWIGADLDNLPSQRGIARAGFRHVADLLIERVLAMRLAWVQGCPGVAEPLVAEARRVFLDNRDQVWLEALSASLRDR
jgi:ribosomal protein S18 acetylase RimI-like enzyme